MDKEEQNFNIWGEKFLTVRWCLKLQRQSKNTKNNKEKRRFAKFARNFAGH